MHCRIFTYQRLVNIGTSSQPKSNWQTAILLIYSWRRGGRVHLARLACRQKLASNAATIRAQIIEAKVIGSTACTPGTRRTKTRAAPKAEAGIVPEWLG